MLWVYLVPFVIAWQVEFPEGGNQLRLNGRELNLVQFHFHTPSEHAFDGLRFPMEAHLVHRK